MTTQMTSRDGPTQTEDDIEFDTDWTIPPPRKDAAWREWIAVGVFLTALLSILALILSVVAISSNASTTTTVAAAAPPAAAAAAVPAAPAPHAVKMTVKTDTEHGKRGPDGKWHDAILGGNLNVKAGQTVTVTVSNYDTAPHTYTAPSLNINERIPGGSATNPSTAKFTFKAPSTPGTYQWFCAFPCDPWSMAHDGYMRGHITVTA